MKLTYAHSGFSQCGFVIGTTENYPKLEPVENYEIPLIVR